MIGARRLIRELSAEIARLRTDQWTLSCENGELLMQVAALEAVGVEQAVYIANLLDREAQLRREVNRLEVACDRIALAGLSHE